MEEIMEYMASIANTAGMHAESKWSSSISCLKTLIESYEDKLECTEQWEGITEEEKQHLETEWESSLKKLCSLLGSLYHYCRQVPVLSFNSARYDLNLAKSHLIPWLRADVDPEEEQDSVDINVIKKGSAYTQIGARRFKFLYISNYLAGGVSCSAFLKAYKI